jgi:hypothetical protein
MEFELEMDFSLNMFRSAFIHSTHLSTRGLSSMVFEHLWDLFDPEDLANIFSQVFMVYFYVVARHILDNIAKAFSVTKLLALAKSFGDI